MACPLNLHQVYSSTDDKDRLCESVDPTLDSDSDGLSDCDEIRGYQILSSEGIKKLVRTNPNSRDTDSDGIGNNADNDDDNDSRNDLDFDHLEETFNSDPCGSGALSSDWDYSP